MSFTSFLFKLLTLYRDLGNLNRVQVNYNILHARTRQIIERVFALLLCRFRRLKYLYLQNVQYAPLIVLACCCLHNISLSLNDMIEEDLISNVDDLEQSNDENDDPVLQAPRENINVHFDEEVKREINAN